MRGLVATTIALLLTTSGAQAGAYCEQTIKLAIVNNAGGIYFTTDKSCLNWCQINPDISQAQQDRMYSMLLTSASNCRKVTIYFDSATGCEALPVYSQPSTFLYPGL
ncbi:hypothetical protein TS85_00205 [Sphingomonas hengshuiensis]|uniref:Uncharacterized protein n=2 Tax=Sphingomonas hengshuiensis TaxID=1609977 RepID=A0A7U5CUK0_9SPHN|nr:hypothetical protein TS85_00205 [Sphingomonas hengshuiensis]